MKNKKVKSSPKKLTITPTVKNTHTKDFFKWTRDQVSLLKNQEFAKLDISNLIEEIESLGNSERNAIESYLIVLFVHMLKSQCQPAMNCKSWENSIENAKFRIKRLVQKNPSLKKCVADYIADAYFSARLQASSETGLDKKAFPDECPWNLSDLFSRWK